jgi:hypothetical protein
LPIKDSILAMQLNMSELSNFTSHSAKTALHHQEANEQCDESLGLWHGRQRFGGGAPQR